MAASSSLHSNSYVEVYVWLGKDNEGYTTTSSEGGRLHRKDALNHELKGSERGLARCGHVSMGLFPKDREIVYISLWPGTERPAELVESLEKDQSQEGTLPDVIIRLTRLNVGAMLEAFNQAKARVANNEITWVYQVSDSEDVTTPSNSRASCASFVYSFLKIGDFGNSSSRYYEYLSPSGPKDKDFYKITKCNAGDRFGGWFNWAPWTGWIFSPKALLLRTASAAEAHSSDKDATIEIMQSIRVAKEKEKGWTQTVVVVAGVAAVMANAYVNKNS